MAAGNDQDEIMVSLDMRKMYYRMNKQAAATALRDRGEWQLLRAMKAAFCEGANTLINMHVQPTRRQESTPAATRHQEEFPRVTPSAP